MLGAGAGRGVRRSWLAAGASRRRTPASFCLATSAGPRTGRGSGGTWLPLPAEHIWQNLETLGYLGVGRSLHLVDTAKLCPTQASDPSPVTRDDRELPEGSATPGDPGPRHRRAEPGVVGAQSTLLHTSPAFPGKWCRGACFHVPAPLKRERFKPQSDVPHESRWNVFLKSHKCCISLMLRSC